MNISEKLNTLLLKVATVSGVHIDLIRGRSLEKEVVALRQSFCLLAEKLGLNVDASLTAKAIHRNRCTVFHSIKKAKERIDFDPYFKEVWSELKKIDLDTGRKKIKEIRFNAITKTLIVEFVGGGKYGETGEIAVKTFMKLQERDFDNAESILSE